MDSLRHDLRQARRFLAGNPGLAALAVLAFGLGIGATTTMYSITHGFLRELPFPEAERLLYVTQSDPRTGRKDVGLDARTVVEWRRELRSVEGLAAFSVGPVALADASAPPERHSGARVSPEMFALLRARPALGRTLVPADTEPGAPAVVVLAHSVWTARFGADPAVIGRAVRVDGRAATVVGVMPPGFQFPFREELWVPLRAGDDAGAQRVPALARLTSGATLEGARAELATLARRTAAAAPSSPDSAALTARALPFREQQVEPSDEVLFSLMVALASFVLLVACANVANLLLVRAASRRRELAVRSALGAGRGRIVRQAVAECLAVATLGGALGLGLAYAAVEWFNGALAGRIPNFWMVVRVDPAVAAFAFALVLAATLVAGLGPALRAASVDAAEALKEQSRGSAGPRLGRLTRALVVGEVALSCALLVVAGLTVIGARDRAVEPLTFDGRGLLTARLELPASRYPDPAARVRAAEQILSRLAAEPAVAAATMASQLPGLAGAVQDVTVEPAAGAVPDDASGIARVTAVLPGYFEALGVRAAAGRLLATLDGATAPRVAVVSRSFATRFFGLAANPVGRRLRFGADSSAAPWVTVVGVVPDARPSAATARSLETRMDIVYLTYAQAARASMFVVARTTGGDPLRLTPTLHRAVAAVDPDLATADLRTLDQALAEQRAPARTFALLFAACGGAALCLATVGLFGVVAYATRQRAQEFGIRAALGATPGALLRLAARGGVVQLAAGLAAGLALAALLSPAMSAFLFGVSPWDWRVYAAVAGALGLTGLGASLLPARAAARPDLVGVLRGE